MFDDRIDPGKALSPNHSTAYPARLLFLDTETRPVEKLGETRHRFILGCTRYVRLDGAGGLDRDQWEQWEDPLDLCRRIEALSRDRTALTVYGHNLWFDLQACGFFRTFASWGWRLGFIYDEGLTFLLSIRNGGRSIRCVSTTNYFDFSLAALGRDIGLEKLDVDFDSVSRSELLTYCRRDVEITAESVFKYMQFCRAHDTGRFSYTKASQALACFRHRFMDGPLMIHKHERAVALERLAYHGGRTECYRIGEPKGGPFIFLDVNSMYPSVMRSHTFPDRLLGYWNADCMQVVSELSGRAALVASCTIETESPAYAVKLDGKTVFPVGRFQAFLCSGGIARALARGELKRVDEVAAYSRSPIFRSYVDYWYPLKARYKAEGSPLYTRIVKLFLNGLYGKFGERRFEEEWIEDWSSPDAWREECASLVSGEHWVETHMFNTTIIRGESIEGPRSFVAVAAHVTEYARLALWELIESVGRGRVLYCDTDSIVLRASDLALVDQPIDPSALGALSVDKSCARLVIHGPKDYEADELVRLKGVPARAEKQADGSYVYDQFLRSASHLRRHVDEGVLLERRTKRLRRVYDKGVVSRSGSVRPYRLTGG